MHVLLSGTFDKLGQLIARQLQLRGYRLRLLTYPGMSTDSLADTGAERIAASSWDPLTLTKALDGCEAVIHLGHSTLDYLFPPGRHYFYAPEVDTTIQLIEASKRADINRFVLVSSADTVGPGSRDQPATEWEEFTLFRIGSPRINSKFLMESYVLEQVRRGFPAVVLNPTQVLGATDWWPPLSRPGRRLSWVPSGGGNIVSPSAVAQGVLGGLEWGRIGERYLLAGENLRYVELWDIVREMNAQHPRLCVRLPAWGLLIAGQLADFWRRMNRQQKGSSAATLRLLAEERYYDGRKAERELGMPLVPVRQALQETMAALPPRHASQS